MPRLLLHDADEAEWARIEQLLTNHQVPMFLRSELRLKLAGEFDGLLLYGSWARGDAGAESDLDVLALNYSGMAPPRDGWVSVALYSTQQLTDASGTLFGYHLVRDGQILVDYHDRLAAALGAIDPPAPRAVIERIQALTSMLDVSATDRATYIEGLTQTARYLLRSALYAEALDQGRPCFSVNELAKRKDDPYLIELLSAHKSVRPVATAEVFYDVSWRLSHVVGGLVSNPYGDLHGLIEGAWEQHRELSVFATLALSQGEDDLPYDELPKVVL